MSAIPALHSIYFWYLFSVDSDSGLPLNQETTYIQPSSRGSKDSIITQKEGAGTRKNSLTALRDTLGGAVGLCRNASLDDKDAGQVDPAGDRGDVVAGVAYVAVVVGLSNKVNNILTNCDS